SVDVLVPGHGGSGGGAKWYVRGASLGLRTQLPVPLSSRSGGDNTMVSHLFYYQLALLALVWLFIMLHLTWPKRSAATTAPATPIQPKPKPFAGLTTKPPCAVCAREAAHPQPPPLVPPAPIPPTHRRPRTVDTSQHFCPQTGCRYRGWLGRGNLR